VQNIVRGNLPADVSAHQSGRAVSGAVLFVALAVFLTGCTVDVGGRRRPLIRHERIRGEIELVAERYTEKDTSGGTDQKSVVDLFEERVRFRTQGDVYHQNLLQYDASVGVGLTQQDLDSDEESVRSNDSLNDYSFSGTFLRSKPYPVTAQASKAQFLVPRSFLSALRTEIEGIGTGVSYVSKEWPMRFRYSTTETTQESLTNRPTDFFDRKDERIAYSLTRNFTEFSELNFNFERNEASQKRLGGETKLTSDRYALRHDHLFGPTKENVFDSFVSLLDTSGDADSQNLYWRENLELKHSANLLTNYRFAYTDWKQETVQNDETRLEWGFEHSLYESLVTRGRLFTSKFDVSGVSETDQVGGSLAFDYRKANRWGQLLGNYSYNFVNLDQKGEATTGVVIDEPHVYDDPLPILLDKSLIDTSTIVVTDSTGLTVYIEGDDYTVIEIGFQVELQINPFGSGGIANGQLLLVDYEFFVEPDREEDTVTQFFSLRQRFINGFSVYYRYATQDESIDTSTAYVSPDEFTEHGVGADYSRNRLQFRVEYGDRSSTKIPSRRTLVSGSYGWIIGSGSILNLWASQLWQDFGGLSARDTRLFRLGATAQSRLSDRYTLLAGLEYRDESDSLAGTTEGVDLNCELEYRYRQLRVSTGFDFGLLDRSESKRETTLLFFRVRRSF
jgi:hypothetical protein